MNFQLGINLIRPNGRKRNERAFYCKEENRADFKQALDIKERYMTH